MSEDTQPIELFLRKRIKSKNDDIQAILKLAASEDPLASTREFAELATKSVGYTPTLTHKQKRGIAKKLATLPPPETLSDHAVGVYIKQNQLQEKLEKKTLIMEELLPEIDKILECVNTESPLSETLEKLLECKKTLLDIENSIKGDKLNFTPDEKKKLNQPKELLKSKLCDFIDRLDHTSISKLKRSEQNIPTLNQETTCLEQVASLFDLLNHLVPNKTNSEVTQAKTLELLCLDLKLREMRMKTQSLEDGNKGKALTPKDKENLNKDVKPLSENLNSLTVERAKLKRAFKDSDKFPETYFKKLETEMDDLQKRLKALKEIKPHHLPSQERSRKITQQKQPPQQAVEKTH